MADMKFLAELKSDFEPVRSQILGSTTLPSVVETYQHVLRSTSWDLLATPYAPDHLALVTLAPQPPAGRGGGNPHCGGYRGGHGGCGCGGPLPHCWEINKKVRKKQIETFSIKRSTSYLLHTTNEEHARLTIPL